MPELTTGAESTTTDVRARHSAALAHLESCRARVRELNSALVSERIELVDSKRVLKRLAPDGREVPAGDRTAWAVVTSPNLTGSRWVPVETDPITRHRARLAYPAAVEQLRHAELDELELRQQVDELDRIARHREKLRRLPAVAKAYAELDRQLVKAAAQRQAVIEAINAVGEISSADALVSANLAWPELNAELLAHRRAQVKAWTSQATTNGNGTS